MKAVVQRVIDASVTVNGALKGRVGFGLLVYLGVARDDTAADADWLAEKIAHLRIFNDSEEKMNLSLVEIVNQYNDVVNNMSVNQSDSEVNFNVNLTNSMVNIMNPHLTVENTELYRGIISPIVLKPRATPSNSVVKNLNYSPGVLAVSQFTLLGDARKGRRPSWGKAAPPEKARELYDYFMYKIREQGLPCESGEFQAHMKVSYTNDGPVTILLDSEDR